MDKKCIGTVNFAYSDTFMAQTDFIQISGEFELVELFGDILCFFVFLLFC